MNILAQIISWIFIPLNAPVFALLIGLFSPSYRAGNEQETLYFISDELKWYLLEFFFIFSFAIPVLSLGFLKINGIISSITVPSRTERKLPALIVLTSALGLYVLLILKAPNRVLPDSIYSLSLGALIAVALCTVITFKWKISLHALGMGIITGFLIGYFSTQSVFPFWVLPIAIIGSGLVISARMALELHSLTQSMAGYFLGLFCVAVTVMVY